jgi:benzoyl-CoA 2,3-dioxygenase component A
MEEGVLQALRDIALDAGLNWTALKQDLKQQGRLQLETY